MQATSKPPMSSPRLLWLFASIALFSISLTVLWLGMRSVMDIGGFCASGGPYVIQHECPEGVTGLMSLAPLFMIVSLFIYGATMTSFTSIILMWGAIFISLGYNFWTYGLNPPVGDSIVWGWMAPAIMFFLMGGLPLLALHPIKYISSLFHSEPYTGGETNAHSQRWVVFLIHLLGVGLGLYAGLRLFYSVSA